MKKIAIVVHGGAGGDSERIRNNKTEYERGLESAVNAGYTVLKNNGSATDAVEAAIQCLEDNPLFNSGRGSAINAKGEVEMCASIMNGKDLKSGAVAIVKNVKNPVSLAKAVMLNTNYIYLGGEGALNYARTISVELEPDSYFITEYQYDQYSKKRKDAFDSNRQIALDEITSRYHGTVGAVALDGEGNVAAGTSTGGTEYCKEGRIADSSMIGIGTYANNETCAVSCTGDGEYLMKGVIAHAVSALVKYKGMSVSEACKEVVHKENKDIDGDLGVIAISTDGDIGIEFNSERMHRGWKVGNGRTVVKIYNK